MTTVTELTASYQPNPLIFPAKPMSRHLHFQVPFTSYLLALERLTSTSMRPALNVCLVYRKKRSCCGTECIDYSPHLSPFMQSLEDTLAREILRLQSLQMTHTTLFSCCFPCNLNLICCFFSNIKINSFGVWISL